MSPIIVPITPSSGPVTTDDLIARTKQLLAEQGVDDFYDSQRILDALNDGLEQTFNEIDVFPEIETVVLDAHTSNLDLSARFAKIERLIEASTRAELTPVRFIEIPDYTAEGTPEFYCPEFLDATTGNKVVRVFPTTDIERTYSVKFWRVPDRLDSASLGAGHSDINPTWHTRFAFVPCYWAAGVLLHMDNLPEEAIMQEQRFYAARAEYRSWVAKSFPPRIVTTESVIVGEM